MGEWLGALGLAWPRLLLYPGGVSALLLAWLLDRVLTRNPRRGSANGKKTASLLDISAAVAPLLLISLLPLPQSGFFWYTPDLPVALILLEWPQFLLIARTLRSTPTDGAERQQITIEGYLLLLMASLIFVQAAGSFRLAALTQSADPPRLSSLLLRLVGMAGWSIALLPLLGIGPCTTPTATGMPGWGMRLRTLGHILLASLPWLPLVQPAPWLLPLPLLLLVLLPGLLTHRGNQFLSRHWQRLRTGTLILLTIVICWQTYTALANRLS